MTILIEKKCSDCGASPCRLMGAAIAGKKIKGKLVKKSYNMYWCPKCHTRFLIERSGNKTEQKLTEKYIKSSKIKLNIV